MKKILILLTAMVLPAYAGGAVINKHCKAPTNSVLSLGQNFELGYGEQATIESENLTITFTKILEDSRCPTGVQCIWAGNARIKLKLEQPSAGAAFIELNTSERYESRSAYLTYTIELLQLMPYPDASQPMEASAYCAVITVSTQAGG